MSEQAGSKSIGVAYLLWFFLGAFGGHRFYMGRKGSGFGMLGLFIGSVVLSVIGIGLLGLAALGVWALVDAFLIPKWMQESGSSIAGSVQPETDQQQQAA